MNTANTRPRFRTDLVAQPLDEGGQRFVDVTDPDSGSTFRFYEIEYSIACAMDGKRDLVGLSEWAQAEIGLSPTPEELETVISTLADLGYLETSPGGDDEFDDAFALGTAGATYNEDDEPLPSGGDFELGTAGKSLLDVDHDDNLDAANLTLGLPGNESLPPVAEETFTGVTADDGPTQVKRAGSHFGEPPAPPAEEAEVRAVLRPVTPMGHAPDEDDGPTNLPPPASDFDDEMSVDLTDHMRIGTADVKEAIRQSQAMQAVDVPAALAEAAAAQAEPEKKAAPAAPARPQTRPPASPVATTELPDKPAMVSAKEEPGFAATPQPAAGGSRTPLIIALVALLIVAGIAGAYFYVQSQKGQEAAPETGAVQPTEAPAVAEEPEPEPAQARMVLVETEAVEVKATREGSIAEILESGSTVAEGDVVVKLNGYQSFEPKIAAAENDQRRYEKRIEDTEAKKAEAEAQGNQAAVDKHQKYIDLHQAKIDEKKQRADAERQEMEAFFLRAPVAGTLETELAARATVKADAVAFRLQPAPVLEATFTLSEETVPAEPPAENADVELAVEADDSKKVMCQVSKVNGQEVTVTCPADSDLKEDDEVVLL